MPNIFMMYILIFRYMTFMHLMLNKKLLKNCDRCNTVIFIPTQQTLKILKHNVKLFESAKQLIIVFGCYNKLGDFVLTITT